MRIAMVSEHASPLAVLGGVDSGGQNVHVADLARALGRQGVEVVGEVVHVGRELVLGDRLRRSAVHVIDDDARSEGHLPR